MKVLCFYINISKSTKAKLGESVQLEFTITQHKRDEDLMNSLISYFDSGYIKKINKTKYTLLDYKVTE